jgi:hypothetical protein
MGKVFVILLNTVHCFVHILIYAVFWELTLILINHMIFYYTEYRKIYFMLEEIG